MKYEFSMRNKNLAYIELVDDPRQIDKQAACQVLCKSFVEEYKKYLHPCEIDEKLKCWWVIDGDYSVEQYYIYYFKQEVDDFMQNKLYWIQAVANNRLLGWATYDKLSNDADSHYMNLLIVDPEFQKQGIGKELVLSVIKFKLIPTAKKINLLLRRKNRVGKDFYSCIGFKANPNFTRHNFVDTTLLEGWSLEIEV